MSKNCKMSCKLCEGTVSDDPQHRPRQKDDDVDDSSVNDDPDSGKLLLFFSAYEGSFQCLRQFHREKSIERGF